MANINISVDCDGLYTIELDKFEWQELKVDGISVPKYTGTDKNIQFQYTQTSKGAISFNAISNKNIGIVYGPTHLLMKNKEDQKDVTNVCFISYGDTGDHIHLFGFLTTLDGHLKDSECGKLGFTMVRMTGQFESICKTYSCE
ncbi:MAG: hypothetical protein AB8B56_17615 [Crocinitomicaceae bacterium]